MSLRRSDRLYLESRPNPKKGVAVSSPQQAQDIPTDDLRAQLEGDLTTPDDPAYDAARQVFFKGFDRHPLAVAKVATAEDVGRIVTAARQTGLELAVRS